jgi:hypothetical protein
MSDDGTKPGSNGREERDEEERGHDSAEYDIMLVLERLESLEEDMVELDVSTLEEVRQRIAALHQRLDEDG